jgi:hypothetical protein
MLDQRCAALRICATMQKLPFSLTLLRTVPFCEGPNKKSEGFAKEKQKTLRFAKEKKSTKFAMRSASQLVAHQSSQI